MSLGRDCSGLVSQSDGCDVLFSFLTVHLLLRHYWQNLFQLWQTSHLHSVADELFPEAELGVLQPGKGLS